MTNERHATVDELLARVRQICFDFAGTEEKLSHGAPFFHVRGKGFVTFASDHHGDGRVAVWCKSTPEEQKRLVASDPDVYFVPPYVGVKGWVGVRLERPTTDFIALAMVVEEAWRSVVPKRLEGAAPKPPPKTPVYPKTDPEVAARGMKRLAALCEALPGTVTETGAGYATFRVGKKPYAYFLDNHHRDGIVAACFKCDDGAALVAGDAKRFYTPAYIGARGWVGMRLDTKKIDWDELAQRVAESHRGVAPTRSRR